MRKTILILVIFLLPISIFADESNFEKELSELWKDDRITPEQPFKAKIVAAGGLSPWSGEIVVYLREDDKNGRVLQVRIGVVTGSGISYKEIKNTDFDTVLEWKGDTNAYNACVFITPVGVSQFVWVSPLGDVGKKLGKTDIVRQAYLTALQKKAGQAGTGQPATRPESKPEGGDKPQPESEGRSR